MVGPVWIHGFFLGWGMCAGVGIDFLWLFLGRDLLANPGSGVPVGWEGAGATFGSGWKPQG